MTVLEDYRKEVELTLPHSGGKVWIYDSMLARDSIDIEKIYVSDVSIEATAGKASPVSMRAIKYYEAVDATMMAMVSRWDFTDKDSKPIDVTLENLKELPQKDFEYIQKEVDSRVSTLGVSKEEKKN